MSKNYDRASELLALRSICEVAHTTAGAKLLGKLVPEHFASGTGRSSFNRILKQLRRTGEVPEWHELCADPGLDESIKEELQEFDKDPIVSSKKLLNLHKILQGYKQRRDIIEAGAYLEKALSDPSLDIEEIRDQAIAKLSGVHGGVSFKLLNIGEGANFSKVAEKLLEGTAIDYIPTGFAGYDSINRGFHKGSFVIIAAETGGGKSTLMGNLVENMAMSGARCGVLPLEMTNTEVLLRDMARFGATPLTDLIDPQVKLTQKQRDKLLDDLHRRSAAIDKRGGRISYIEFDGDVTLTQALSNLRPYDFDVVVLDYIGLLSGLDSDDQWRAMGKVAREAKIWAKNTNTLFIAIAQLSSEGLLRYSRGMAEHANNMWIWLKDKAFVDTGIAQIKQPKARQASDHDFYLQFDFPRMSVTDATDEEIEKRANVADSGKNKSKRRWEANKEADSDDDDAWMKKDTTTKRSSKDREI